MSKEKVEYFNPGRSLLLVAVLLLVSMGLQFFTLPQVLKPSVNGELVEGTVVGVVLIFSYTLTTLGFLFLLMEYFNLKNKVQVYSKLTGQILPSEALEKIVMVEEVAPLTITPPEEKPTKKGLFSGFGKKAKKDKITTITEPKQIGKRGLFGWGKKNSEEKTVKEPKQKGKGGLLSFLKKKEPMEKTPKEPKLEKKGGFNLFKKKDGDKKSEKTEEKIKTPKPGILTWFTRKKETPETIVEEHVIKKITIEAANLPSEKPASNIEPVKVPIIDIPKADTEKPPVVLIQKTSEPTALVSEVAQKKDVKPSTSVADLLGGVSLVAKPKDEVTQVFEKLKPTGVVAEEKKVDPAPAASQNKAVDLLQSAADANAQDDLKYKTVGVKVPVAEPDKKPAVVLPPITIPPAPPLEPVKLDDSEFLKVLTELRLVVDDMKIKKKGNVR